MNMGTLDIRPSARATGWGSSGVVLALAAATVSGVAIFVNGLAVKQFSDAVAYTTAKNAVAALLLFVLATTVTRRGPVEPRPPLSRTQWAGLIAVGIVGGGVAFALFFEGLARASSVEAAFIHKTLVVWVVILAIPLLHERIGPLHFAAVAVLVVGQATLAGDVWNIRPGSGELMILGATVLWAGETVLAKHLLSSVGPLRLGVTRLSIGLVVLVTFLVVSGRADGVLALTGHQWSLVALNGAILGTYVATWFTALRRAPAVDVTAVLVFGAVITALLATGFQSRPLGPDLPGLGLVIVGTILAAAAARSPTPRWIRA